MKIVVVGLGYVGLSNAVLLAQHNEVIGVDISPERVDALNARKSPIIDAELSEYLTEKDLNLSASTDLKASLTGADYVIVSTPTNYDETTNFFDTSSVETVIAKVIANEPDACIVVKSTIPVGFVEAVRLRLKTDALIFSPEFLREGKASAAKAMKCTSLSLPSGAGGGASRGQSIATVSVRVTASVSGMSRYLRMQPA